MAKEGKLNGAGRNPSTDEDSDELNTEDTVVLPEQALVDQESDVADTAIRKIVAPPPTVAKSGADARRRLEDYMEMKRAAQELRDLEEFDID